MVSHKRGGQKKIAVVFGGAGFIGRHLLGKLAGTNAYDVLLSADIRQPHFPVSGVEYVEVDVRETIPVSLCRGVTEIYNLAAVHTTPGHADWEYYWTNVMGATNICQFAVDNKAQFIAFTSSISVYGAADIPRDEGATLEPDSAYGRSKLAAERIHALWQSEGPCKRRLVIVRPAVIYGLGENGNFKRLSQLLARGLLVYPGRSDTVKACGYVEDLVASILWASDRGDPTLIYNFCHTERYTTEQICAAFKRVAGYNPFSATVPLKLMLFVGALFEALSALGLRTPINRARMMKLNQSTNILPAQLQTLGFQYRFDLEQGLQHWSAASSESDFD
jgi:GlcNAc-P-P-Und epimerase